MNWRTLHAQSLTLIFTLAALVTGASCTRGNKVTKDGPKVLHLALSEDVKIADPAQANDTISATLAGNIFEGLLGFSYLGRLDRVEPQLAEALPIIKDKGKTLVFHLRTGVLFQDDPAFPNGQGREVVASDFIYSLKRVGDPQVNSPNWWMFEGMVEGFDQWRDALKKNTEPGKRKALFDAPVAGLQGKGNYELQIKLTRAYPQFLQILSMTHATVVASEVVEKYGPEIGNHPIGTGAFQLKEWVRGSFISLKRNPKYRKDYYPAAGEAIDRKDGLLLAAGKALPFVDEVRFEILKEEQPRWLKFLSGDLDVSSIPKDNFTDAIGGDGKLKPELAAKGMELHKELSLTTWWLEFNMKDPLLGKNLKLRKALAFAFDRARAMEILENNRGILANSVIPPNIAGGDQAPPWPYSFNLEKAKTMLAEAGYPEGKGLPELSFDLRGPGTTSRQMGEFIKDNFAKIGVNIKILPNSFPEALEKQRTSRFQMTLGGWSGDYPDPENFLQLFSSANAAPGPNSSNFSNKEYDDLYNKIRTELPSPDRLKSILRMTEILQQELPAIFWDHSVDYVISRSWLKNYKPHLLLYGASKYLDIDRELRFKALADN